MGEGEGSEINKGYDNTSIKEGETIPTGKGWGSGSLGRSQVHPHHCNTGIKEGGTDLARVEFNRNSTQRLPENYVIF